MRKNKKNTPKQMIRKAKNRGELTSKFSKGMSITTIENTIRANDKTIKETNKKLITPLLKNKKDADKITKEENLKKIKHRFEHEIEVKDPSGQTLIYAKKLNTTPEETIKEIKKTIKEGEEIKEGEKSEGIPIKLKNKGWNVNEEIRGGNAYTVKLTTRFRKG